MQISYRWLGRHVDLSGVDAEEVARLLTLHTAEVEAIERVAPHLDDVVVGAVATREKHPDADKLSVCTVDVGAGEPLQIVCGAPNVDAGQKVAVATVGTVLPGDFKIKKSKIRGVESRGMICSVRELELGDEHDGIWVLDPEAAVGAKVADAVGLVDWALEIDNKAITHRPDLWGHRGMARELAAILGRELRPLDLTLPETRSGTPVPVTIESASCSRYLALEIAGLSDVPTPEWMRQLLLAVGQRPIELSVDVSNFVMFDLGQPNHLFDRAEIAADGIAVRDARPGEKMTTLDGVERELAPEDVLITSGGAPVALGGVMGGAGSAVAAGTKDLLLEVASFHPTVIRRTASRLGLRTDASARFEKGLDPTLPLRAAAHVVRTLAAIAPGIELPSALTDAGDWQDPTRTLDLRPDRVREVIGAPIDDATITRSLEALGFAVTAGGPMRVEVPSFRATKDVTIEEDLVEEVARLYGLNRIEEQPLVAPVRPLPRDRRRELVRTVKDRLAGSARFHEVRTYSFLPDELAERLGVDDERYVEVVNPVHEGWQRVRRSVVPSVLGLLENNLRHRGDVRLFEVGKGYRPVADESESDRGQPLEVHEVALVWAAPKPGQKARFDADRLSALKGVVEDLARAVGVRLEWRADEEQRPAWVHPGRRAVGGVADKKDFRPVAVLSALDPRVARRLGVEADVAAATVSLDALLAEGRPVTDYRPLPKFPGIKIDVALAVPEATPAAEVRAVIERAGKGLVADVELFDLYRGDQAGEGRKSLAYHVLLQSETKTLTDKEGQKFLGRLERSIADLSGELRRE